MNFMVYILYLNKVIKNDRRKIPENGICQAIVLK